MAIYSSKNYIKYLLITSYFVSYCMLQSCKQKTTPIDFAIKWTSDLKAKIIREASQEPDKTVFDSIHHEITMYKNNVLLKHYYFAPRKNANENENPIYDTARIVFYSTNQDFQMIQELCIPRAERSYEGVLYKGNRYGMAEYDYCNKNIKETGFHDRNLNVGMWTTYDSTGKIIKQVDNGNEDRLEKLKDLKF